MALKLVAALSTARAFVRLPLCRWIQSRTQNIAGFVTKHSRIAQGHFREHTEVQALLLAGVAVLQTPVGRTTRQDLKVHACAVKQTLWFLARLGGADRHRRRAAFASRYEGISLHLLKERECPYDTKYALLMPPDALGQGEMV
jgi:hypothetical protein